MNIHQHVHQLSPVITSCIQDVSAPHQSSTDLRHAGTSGVSAISTAGPGTGRLGSARGPVPMALPKRSWAREVNGQMCRFF